MAAASLVPLTFAAAASAAVPPADDQQGVNQ
jgi:hypothetical protein